MNLAQVFCSHKYQRFVRTRTTEQVYRPTGRVLSALEKNTLISVCEKCGKRKEVLI